MYERALELDPEFALAYAKLSLAHGMMYFYAYDPYPSRLEAARVAAEAAMHLAPELPQAHEAMGGMYTWEGDNAKALEELTVAAEGLPGDAQLWVRIADKHRRLGNWDQALAAFEKASELDPRDAWVFLSVGALTYWFLHRYEDAIAASNRALELAPDYASAQLLKALTYLHSHGELDSLRALSARGPEDYDFFGTSDLWRVRLALWERKPEVLLTLLGDTPELVTYQPQWEYTPGLLYAAWAFQLRGDRATATRAFAGALVQLDSVLLELPGDPRVHMSRGLALAGLGRQSEAREVADIVIGYGPYNRAFWGEVRSMIFAQANLKEEALAEIELLLAGPSFTSVHMVRIDPRYDPIRDDPRFQALLDQYEN
jgi:serine/threonine-protein kinase